MKFELPPYATCSFCEDLAGTRECAFVAENEYAAAEIERSEIEAVYSLVRDVALGATVAFGAVGMNVFQNNGSKAGQHEPHFHVHVVPRYKASDPNRRFLQRDYTVISVEEQRAIADLVKAAI